MRRPVRTVLLAALLAAATKPGIAGAVHDAFDAGPLDTTIWATGQIEPRQILFAAPGRCGAGAVTVLTRDSDGGEDCPAEEKGRCQRAEVRVHRTLQPRYGDEVWFAFSFRIDADVPSIGSARTVIGQWKAPGDDSPFLAQRFDNGVFHITVEDNGVRRVVAQASDGFDRTLAAQNLLAGLDPANREMAEGVQALQSLYAMRRSQPDLASRLFSGDLLRSLDDPNARPEAADVARLLHLGRGDLVPAFSAISFVAEPERYIGPAGIRILPQDGGLLPDPRKDWVDMVYRIKGGRTDNEYGPKQQGEIEIWANGRKIVRVEGNLGNRLVLPASFDLVGPYFKFGLYRLKQPGVFAFHFDEFSQAAARDDLALSCLRGP